MTEYWEVRRGLKRGEVPNPTKLVYASYVRFCKANALEIATIVTFRRYLRIRGYKKALVNNKSCWMLNKAIVPRSSINKMS